MAEPQSRSSFLASGALSKAPSPITKCDRRFDGTSSDAAHVDRGASDQRFQEWTAAGVFEEFSRQGLLAYDELVGIDWR